MKFIDAILSQKYRLNLKKLKQLVLDFERG